MSIVVHNFEQPDRFVAGTVGEPGQRTAGLLNLAHAPQQILDDPVGGGGLTVVPIGVP